MSLEEELDALRVQTAMDRATIHDLNICLKQEKDALTSRMRVRHQDEGIVTSLTQMTCVVYVSYALDMSIFSILLITFLYIRAFIDYFADRLCSTPKGHNEGKTTSRTLKNLERKLENAAEDNKILKRDKKRLLEDNR